VTKNTKTLVFHSRVQCVRNVECKFLEDGPFFRSQLFWDLNPIFCDRSLQNFGVKQPECSFSVIND